MHAVDGLELAFQRIPRERRAEFRSMWAQFREWAGVQQSYSFLDVCGAPRARRAELTAELLALTDQFVRDSPEAYQKTAAGHASRVRTALRHMEGLEDRNGLREYHMTVKPRTRANLRVSWAKWVQYLRGRGYTGVAELWKLPRGRPRKIRPSPGE